MFDTIILSIDRYAIWAAIGIGLYKILHIVLYKGFQPGYLVNTYFTIFSGVEITDTKNYRQRYRFRKVHNLLTVIFYSLLILWCIIHIILMEV